MSKIPRTLSPDSTLALAFNGYEFIANECRHHQSDVFQTRLLFEKTICLRGAEAAEIFYDTERFTRQGATPERVQKTLFGKGGVQATAGKAHQHRKQLFMSLMTPERIGQLADLTRERLHQYAQKWETMEQVVLFPEIRELLCRAVCDWCGVPLPESEVEQRTRELGAMIDSAGAIGPKHWLGRLRRNIAEDWIRETIEKVRSNQLTPPEDSALHAMSWHRGLEGNLLDSQIAAVDLINVLRPTVAIARYSAKRTGTSDRSDRFCQTGRSTACVREWFSAAHCQAYRAGSTGG